MKPYSDLSKMNDKRITEVLIKELSIDIVYDELVLAAGQQYPDKQSQQL